MRYRRALVAAAGLAAVLGLGRAVAQPKQPAFPPLNLGVAKLSQTFADLGGPAVGLAALDDKGAVVACEDRTLRYWAKEEDKDLLAAGAKGLTLKGHAAAITAVAAGGETVASADTAGKVLLWSPPGDKPTLTLTAGKAVRALAVSADGKSVASAGDDGAVQLWDPAGAKLVRKLTGPTDWLLAVAFSPDGKAVAAGGQDGKLWAWDADSGNKLFDVLAQAPVAPKAPPPAANVVSALAFSPDGKTVAVGGSDARVYLFQANDGKFLRQVQAPGHTASITALAFHPGGTYLASASKDNTLRLWTPQNGQALKTFTGHTSWAQGVAFFDKGTQLVSAGADRSARLWALTAPTPPKKK